MATAKAKTVTKAGAKKTAKAPVKKAAAKTAAPKVKKAVAKAATVKKVVAAKPVVHTKAVAKPVAHKPAPPKNESVFARLLREKAERHEQFQKQQGQHHANDQRMPQNHASFSKYAGPRRRAS